jgi:Acetamidase/Formamidase family
MTAISLHAKSPQVYLLLSCCPAEGRISGIVDAPNACATLAIPLVIFDQVRGRRRHGTARRGGLAVCRAGHQSGRGFLTMWILSPPQVAAITYVDECAHPQLPQCTEEAQVQSTPFFLLSKDASATGTTHDTC